MSVYILSGRLHDQVNDGAEQLPTICSLSPPSQDVVPELFTVEGFDGHL